jgi:hypothetical protein
MEKDIGFNLYQSRFGYKGELSGQNRNMKGEERLMKW